MCRHSNTCEQRGEPPEQVTQMFSGVKSGPLPGDASQNCAPQLKHQIARGCEPEFEKSTGANFSSSRWWIRRDTNRTGLCSMPKLLQMPYKVDWTTYLANMPGAFNPTDHVADRAIITDGSETCRLPTQQTKRTIDQ